MKVKEAIELLSKVDEDYEIRRYRILRRNLITYDEFKIELTTVSKDEAENSDEGLKEGQEILII